MSVHLTASDRVRLESAADAAEATREFVACVRELEEGTLAYRSLRRADDETVFLRVMTFADEGAEAPHRQTEHVRRCVERLYPLGVEEPVFTRYEPLES